MTDHIDTDDEALEPPLPAKTREERIDAMLGLGAGAGDAETRKVIGDAIDAADRTPERPPSSADLRNYRLRQTFAPPSGTLGQRARFFHSPRGDAEAERRRVRDLATKHADHGDAELGALRERLRADPAFLAEFPIMRDGLCSMLGIRNCPRPSVAPTKQSEETP